MEVGSLTVLTGCMQSGKTTGLARELNRYADVGFKVLCVGYKGDTRSEDALSTHCLGGITLSPNVVRIKMARLGKIDVSGYDVIGVDEAQFFGIEEPVLVNDLYTNVYRWVVEQKKIVVVSGLDGDAKRRPFGHILKLIPLADSHQEFTAHCVECLKNHKVTPARFTYRTAKSSELVLIGGSESYIPLCRQHYEAHAQEDAQVTTSRPS